MNRIDWMRWSAASLTLLVTSLPLAAAPSNHAERMHARALESFRAGRFPEAYGRFIALAQTGHPASARYALWMCEQGLPLFGKNWDCSPDEVAEWASAAGVAPFSVANVAAAADRVAVRPPRR